MYQLKDKDLQTLYLKIDPEFLVKLNKNSPYRITEHNGKKLFILDIGKKIELGDGKYWYHSTSIFYTEDDLDYLSDVDFKGWNQWKDGMIIPEKSFYACELVNDKGRHCKAVGYFNNGKWNFSDKYKVVRFRCWE